MGDDASAGTWSSLGTGARLFRIAHGAWGALNMAALGNVWISAIRGRTNRYLVPSVALLGSEGVALVIGRGNCPFGPFQRSIGDPVPMFEWFLPPRAAKVAIPVLAAVTLCGFAALLLSFQLRGRPGQGG